MSCEIDSIKSELLKIAAYLVKLEYTNLSPYADDMPKTTPKSVLFEVSQQNDNILAVVHRIKKQIDKLDSLKLKESKS